MKKIILFLTLCLTCLCLAGCENKHDTIEVWNKSKFGFDNINIKIKYGYYYDRYDKFTVDENTIGVTIYFSNNIEDTWD